MKPCFLPLLLLCLLCAGVPRAFTTGLAAAADLGQTAPPKEPGHRYSGGGRVGGDTLGDAVTIADLPFSDTGNTCGFADDYDEVCPYTGSTSPEVVYRYEASADGLVTIDLCSSLYDTKAYVWEEEEGQLVACNDDAGCGYSGYQSRISEVPFVTGHTYFIVVDGYGGSCGQYSLTVDVQEPCELTCPAGSQVEGEPPCVDGYVDTHNVGCSGGQGYLEDWQPIFGDESGCGTMCGRSCTYLYAGSNYRDTDWYRVGATGGTLTYECTAEFAVQGILISGTNCGNLQYVAGQAPACQTLTLEYEVEWPRDIWLWVGTSAFSGVEERDYIMHVCGIGPDVSPLGACCVGGACQITYQVLCEFYYGGSWGGPDVICSPNPCLHTGACCLPDGSCVVNDMHECWLQGGGWLFPVGTCDPNPCQPVPVERLSWGAIKIRYR